MNNTLLLANICELLTDKTIQKMIIYEVNLSINNSIYDSYFDWLQSHIEDMLALDGFKHAQVFKVINSAFDAVPSDSPQTHLSVQYTLKNKTALTNYLKHHAAPMRKQAIDKFGKQFSATRRILEHII